MQTKQQVVWGAKAIGEVIGRDPRQTFYLLSKGQIKAAKIGDQWVSTVGELLKQIEGAKAD